MTTVCIAFHGRVPFAVFPLHATAQLSVFEPSVRDPCPFASQGVTSIPTPVPAMGPTVISSFVKTTTTCPAGVRKATNWQYSEWRAPHVTSAWTATDPGGTNLAESRREGG